LTVNDSSARRSVTLVTALLCAACNGHPPGTLDVRLGSKPDSRYAFRAVSGFAKYVELPGAGSELTITLANYEASCERYVPPPEGKLAVAVVVFAPPGTQLLAATYPWLGHQAHGGTPTKPDRAYALPTVRLGRKSHLIEPGGGIELRRVELAREGRVAGLLGFEAPGDADHEATSIAGRFDVPLCSVRDSLGQP
jgi:hypothetical protein